MKNKGPKNFYGRLSEIPLSLVRGNVPITHADIIYEKSNNTHNNDLNTKYLDVEYLVYNDKEIAARCAFGVISINNERIENFVRDKKSEFLEIMGGILDSSKISLLEGNVLLFNKGKQIS